MDKYQVIGGLYRNILKPGLFAVDAEVVHDAFTTIGEAIGNREWALGMTEKLLAYGNPGLKKKVLGVEFPNPVGLAAGFDYNGHMARVMKAVGFGFNTVGTVTARPYEGNTKPRLGRLPKSQSLLVNKGFKSDGAEHVMRTLDGHMRGTRDEHVIGISVGSSNVAEVNTINKAIDDYLFTFEVFKNKPYVKYWELNVSCPNTAMKETFADPINFAKLVAQVAKLKLKQPVFVKMANEIELAHSTELVACGVQKEIRGYIFSNLVKKRDNPGFDRKEMEKIKDLKGNFSGKPTTENALNLVKHARKKFGQDIAIIGLGGIFTPQDAKAYFEAGADLVQLITGMIYQGPQLAGEICQKLGNRN